MTKTPKPKAPAKQKAILVKMPERLQIEERPEHKSLMEVIARAAADPAVDIDKMERLLAMQERMVEKQAEREFHQALNALQPTLPVIKKSSMIDITFKDTSKGKQVTPYAKRENIEKQIRPLYTAAGFSTSYNTRTTDDGKIVVMMKLSHNGGHYELYESPPMVYDTSGSKNNIQAAGSSYEYGKRYVITGAFNVITEDMDDDGKSSNQKGTADGFSARVEEEANAYNDLDEPSVQEKLLEQYGKLSAALRKRPAGLSRGELLMKNTALLQQMDEEGMSVHIEELHKLASELPNEA